MKKIFFAGMLTILSLTIFSLPAPVSDESLSWGFSLLAQKSSESFAQESVTKCYFKAPNDEEFRRLIAEEAAKFDQLNLDNPSFLKNQEISVIPRDLITADDRLIQSGLCILGIKQYIDKTNLSEPFSESIQFFTLSPCGLASPWDIQDRNLNAAYGALSVAVSKSEQVKISGLLGSLNARFCFEYSRCFHPQSDMADVPGIRFIQHTKLRCAREEGLSLEIIKDWQNKKNENIIFNFTYGDSSTCIYFPNNIIENSTIIMAECKGNCLNKTILDPKKYNHLYLSFGGVQLDFLAQCSAMAMDSDSDEN